MMVPSPTLHHQCSPYSFHDAASTHDTVSHRDLICTVVPLPRGKDIRYPPKSIYSFGKTGTRLRTNACRKIFGIQLSRSQNTRLKRRTHRRSRGQVICLQHRHVPDGLELKALFAPATVSWERARQKGEERRKAILAGGRCSPRLHCGPLRKADFSWSRQQQLESLWDPKPTRSALIEIRKNKPGKETGGTAHGRVNGPVLLAAIDFPS